MNESVILADDQPVNPDDETLVAYLDGELSNREREQVESRLINDETFRKRLQELQSSWDWLGELPSEVPSEQLMQSTIELVIADIAPPKSDKASWFAAHRGLILGALLSLLAFAAGVAAMNWQNQRRAQQQLEDLALAEDLEALLQGGDFDLMRELQASVSWDMMVSTYEQLGRQRLVPDDIIAQTPATERENAISNLSSAERDTLENRWKEFCSLDEKSEATVRETARRLREQPDADELIRTMRAYSRWRESLPIKTRQQMETTTGVKRREAIEQAVAYSLGQLSDDSGEYISDETADRIWYQLERLIRQRLEADEQLQTTRERFARFAGEDGSEAMMIGAMVFPRGNRGGRRPGGPPFKLPPPLTDNELIEMTSVLDDGAITDLNALTNWNPYSGRDPGLVVIAMQAWMEEAVRRRRPSGDQEAPANWLERYKQSDDRDVLDLLRPEEIKQRMTSRRPWGR